MENIQHPTSNAQHPMLKPPQRGENTWMLDVPFF